MHISALESDVTPVREPEQGVGGGGGGGSHRSSHWSSRRAATSIPTFLPSSRPLHSTLPHRNVFIVPPVPNSRFCVCVAGFLMGLDRGPAAQGRHVILAVNLRSFISVPWRTVNAPLVHFKNIRGSKTNEIVLSMLAK